MQRPVLVQSEWADEVKIHFPGIEASELSATAPYQSDDGTVHVEEANVSGEFTGKGQGMEQVVVHIPERCNLVVASANESVQVRGKVEGDVRIEAGRGDVLLDKVRGQTIALLTEGDITVATTVEGEHLTISAQKLFAKRIMGDVVDIASHGEVDVGALYAQEFRIVNGTESLVRLGSVHGKGTVESAALEVDSMDGALSASCSGEVKISFDTPPRGKCELHSSRQNITINLPDPQPHDSLITEITACARAINACDSEFETVEKEDIAVEGSNEKLQKLRLRSVAAVEGEGRRVGDTGIGKINIGEAAKETFLRGSKSAPLISASATNGSITLKHVSWVDRIKAKFK